ncbi:MAG: putative rane protein [Candidatus Saccharibacteria bacterium]|nr:putative rane protein [Candidatus Saccharibacteria bacterium]
MKAKYIARKAYEALDGIFTDREAWWLFRAAAFAETFGWTCLIVGIAAVELKWPHDSAYIAIAGSIHGILYLFYLFIVIFGHRALKWSVWRFIFAELISVIPYGALVFELWVSHRRKTGRF